MRLRSGAMSAGRKIGFGLLGLLIGGAVGGAVGLCCGLAYTALAGTSSFEGYSGFVVAYWMLAGIIPGAIAGPILLIRRAG